MAGLSLSVWPGMGSVIRGRLRAGQPGCLHLVDGATAGRRRRVRYLCRAAARGDGCGHPLSRPVWVAVGGGSGGPEGVVSLSLLHLPPGWRSSCWSRLRRNRRLTAVFSWAPPSQPKARWFPLSVLWAVEGRDRWIGGSFALRRGEGLHWAPLCFPVGRDGLLCWWP